ncbi:MAG: zinc dependent phospholipase C family protein [Christensenellaceae bacterium]|jgi:hypothetical protein|nr:zinc dependent phospholipase C family protein [Christensenellaceae bacterium]
MPNALTHKFIAEAVRDSLDVGTKSILTKFEKEYFLGSLGPDILMGLVFETNLVKRDEGERLHNDGIYASFVQTADYLSKNRDDSLYAYFLGFLTHYTTDSTIHPFVYYYIENRLKRKYAPHLSTVIHAIVETEMDVFVGKVYLKGKKADSFYLFKNTARVRRTIRKFFLIINKDVFNLALSVRDMRKSYFLFKLLLFLCHRNRNGSIRFWIIRKIDAKLKADHLFLSVLRPRKIDTSYDYLNMDKHPYRSIHKERFSAEITYSFPEMVELAKKRGIDLLNKAIEHINGGASLKLDDFILNYNGAFNSEYLDAVESGRIVPKSSMELIATDDHSKSFT